MIWDAQGKIGNWKFQPIKKTSTPLFPALQKQPSVPDKDYVPRGHVEGGTVMTAGTDEKLVPSVITGALGFTGIRSPDKPNKVPDYN